MYVFTDRLLGINYGSGGIGGLGGFGGLVCGGLGGYNRGLGCGGLGSYYGGYGCGGLGGNNAGNGFPGYGGFPQYSSIELKNARRGLLAGQGY